METNIEWNNLTFEEQEHLKEKYQKLKEGNWSDKVLANLLVEKFKETSLNINKIKTWEDVVAQQEWNVDIELNKIKNAWIGYPICDKIIATAKIAKLIELGYGGMVTEEEWKDDERVKCTIVRRKKDLLYCDTYSEYEFISFKTPSQREEFMSYPENVELAKQYYML